MLDSDDNFRKVQPGSYANDNCQHAWHTFCSFAGMSIVEDDANMDERLYIDTVSQEGHHILTYDGNSSHGWNTAEITANGIILERNVTRLSIYNMSGTASIPIQDYSGRLYLLFLVKYRPEIVISEDELKKILIIFEEQ